MTAPITVLFKRLKVIAAGGIARILAALGSVIISIIVVRTQSSALWGEVVPYMLLQEFGFSVIGWGVLPYLVQKFSLHPHMMRSEWSKATFSRGWLLVLFLIIILFLSFNITIKVYLIIWAFGRYVYQSFEPIAQVERNFIFSILMETSALLMIIIPIITATTPVHVESVVSLFARSMTWRAAVSIFFYRKWLVFHTPVLAYFKDASPFFLLTISGMLQQRTDLYCVTYFLNKEETATYQVFFNFLIFAQFLSSLLLSPFVKNIFRLSPASLHKLERNFILAGLPLSLASIGVIIVMIRYFYHFELSWVMYSGGYVYILMFHLYLLRNYEMGKSYRQLTVALIGFAGSALNLVLCIFLIPRYGIEGALLSGTAAQCLIVILYQRSNLMGYAKS